MIGLGLENWSMREDKDYQTRQARPIFVAMEQALGQLDGSIAMFSEGTSDAGIR